MVSSILLFCRMFLFPWESVACFDTPISDRIDEADYLKFPDSIDPLGHS